MNDAHMPSMTTRLLQVIDTQSEVAKLGLDLGAVMTLVADRAQLITHAAGAVVELAEDDDMVYRAATGKLEAHLGLRLKRDGSLSGLSVREGQVLRCDDSETDSRVDREACRRVGLRSMLVVPLRHSDTVVGVLKVISERVAAFDADDQHILGLMSDLIAAAMYHAARAETRELFYRATHDALTGLANRALFYDRLRHCVARAQREERRFGILNLDMDGLKPINDGMGHRTGDAALKEFAQRLRRVSRNSDTIARLGGDEFALILSYIEGREGAVAHASRLTQSIAAPFEFETRPVPLDASIGIAVYPDDGAEIESLMEKADQAMYAVKRGKKGQVATAAA